MTYDYIIIGAGTAGCVLANRLSANAANSVLLVEAGGRDIKPEIHVPGAYIKLFKSSVDWGFWTAPQKHILNRKIYLPRGKTLGGCSSTNAMAYVRGNKADYDDWEALGNKGWSYHDVLPYFKKSEDHEDFEDEYHNRGGELNVVIPQSFDSAYKEAFMDACVEQGFERNKDYNGVKQEGVGLVQSNIKNGKRYSTAVAFLNPIKQRKNLTILTGAPTRKIQLEKGRAIGIEIGGKGKSTKICKAKKEVILSAGAFASPQLLMLSGIGDKAALKHAAIDCVHPLAGVGQNLQDHLMYPISALSKDTQGLNHHSTMWGQAKGIVKWLMTKKGAFSVSPLEAFVFGKSSDSPNRVDYQFHYSSFHLGGNYKADFYDLSTFPRTDGFMILPTLLKPKSRGFVGLRNNDPFERPLIQPNFLEAEADRKLLLETGKIALAVLKAKAFDAYRKEIIMPSDYSSDETFFHHILKTIETVYHPVGTCKMGKDDMAVVDNQLRVHGIEGLRVIDASIMPTIVAGNTNAPTVMIAEKGADLILKA